MHVPKDRWTDVKLTIRSIDYLYENDNTEAKSTLYHPITEATNMNLSDDIRTVKELLTDEELYVIEARYGDVELTYNEIGEAIGCSGVTVKKIEKRALKKMKTLLI